MLASQPWYLWVGFNLFVLAMLALDLGVFHRKAHAVSFREAMTWTTVWIVLALLFDVGVYYGMGPAAGMEFLTGYVVEKSLSVDNIFVILLIFSYFRVPSALQHKVLFWGILGALAMRALFILMGVALIQKYHWIIYVFGAFLLVTGVKMAFSGDKEVDLEANVALRWFRKLVPFTTNYHGDSFFVSLEGRRVATPLFAALVLIEATDLVFAVDSIPAILAISPDPFIVYTSNVFAILGLRSLYFAVSGLMELFHYLRYGLAAILAFVGAKMMVAEFYKIPVHYALGVILAILLISIGASVVRAKRLASSSTPR